MLFVWQVLSSWLRMKHLVAVVLLVSVKGLDLNIDDKHSTPLGACQACKTVVKSFQAVSDSYVFSIWLSIWSDILGMGWIRAPPGC